MQNNGASSMTERAQGDHARPHRRIISSCAMQTGPQCLSRQSCNLDSWMWALSEASCRQCIRQLHIQA